MGVEAGCGRSQMAFRAKACALWGGFYITEDSNRRFFYAIISTLL